VKPPPKPETKTERRLTTTRGRCTVILRGHLLSFRRHPLYRTAKLGCNDSTALVCVRELVERADDVSLRGPRDAAASGDVRPVAVPALLRSSNALDIAVLGVVAYPRPASRAVKTHPILA
jgi:hypothetical protein